jgi:hypothetical protein
MNDKKPEALPPEEHKEVCVRFLKIVAMEVRPGPHNALASMMYRRALRQETASRFLRDLWLRPIKVETSD